MDKGLTSLVPQDDPNDQEFRDTFNALIGMEDEARGLSDSGEVDKNAIAKTASEYSKYVYDIGMELQGKFMDVETVRRDMEDRWLEDLRQYRGEYDPSTLGAIHPNRSKAYVRITYNKIKTINSRLSDLLFPNVSNKNWGIRPTPIPDLGEAEKLKITIQMSELLGHPPSEQEYDEIMTQLAKQRCEAMEKEIEDQLAGLRYRDIIRSVLNSGNLYGTGVLKGPLVKETSVKRWLKDTAGQWTSVESTSVTPYAEFVPVWDIYPDMSAVDSDDLRFVFQRHVMGKDKLFKLAKRTDFHGDALKSYLKARPNGNATYKSFETELQSFRDAPQPDASRENRYEVLEYWGYCDVAKLKEIPGFELPEDYDDDEVAVNIWLIDNVVIKAVVSPLDEAIFPYFFYYFSKDETSIFGEGLASVMRDPQMLANAAIRVMMDNAAISAGPIIEANLDLLPDNEDPTDMHPFKVLLRTGSGNEAAYPAMRVETLPSYTQEFMNMFDLFIRIGDDISTIPRYMYGDSGSNGGASRTASGLSMLMGAANTTLKEQVKNFDEGITKPFIKALYFWNMEFNPKKEIKGDYEIQALGTTSLIAKEVRAESILRFIQLTSNPADIQLTNRSQVIREYAKSLELDDEGFVKSEQQLSLERQQQAQAEAVAASQRMQMQQQQAVLDAYAGGHAPGQD